MNQFSIWAYEDIVASGYLKGLRAEMLSIFSMSPDVAFSMKEIQKLHAREFGIRKELSVLSTRFSELSRMGYIEVICEKTDPVTGQKCGGYQYTGNKKPFPKQTVKMECPTCKGCGVVEKEVYIKPDENNSQMDLF